MNRKIVNSSSPIETSEIARACYEYAKKGSCVALYGNLGAGKTLFAQNLISELTDVDTNSVTSPTFNIVQTYDSPKGLKIYHYDLYRLKSRDEIYEVGFEESLERGFSIIEWPEIIEDILPDDTVYIKITKGEDETSRVIEILNYPC